MTEIHSTLASLVDGKTPEDLKAWALDRLCGKDDRPLLYGGREPEASHEAVAACFNLDLSHFTSEKRAAVLEALKTSYCQLHEALTEGTVDNHQLFELEAWAQVVEAARPAELSKQASALLHACNLASDQTGAALGRVAAAATALPKAAENDEILWRRLLNKPQSAALAFRRLLPSLSLDEAAGIWVDLLRRHLKQQWPVNPRLLLVPLLKKAEQSGKDKNISWALFDSLKKEELVEVAIQKLESSRSSNIRTLIETLQKLKRNRRLALNYYASMIIRESGFEASRISSALSAFTIQNNPYIQYYGGGPQCYISKAAEDTKQDEVEVDEGFIAAGELISYQPETPVSSRGRRTGHMSPQISVNSEGSEDYWSYASSNYSNRVLITKNQVPA